jgi:hypothetical protein
VIDAKLDKLAAKVPVFEAIEGRVENMTTRDIGQALGRAYINHKYDIKNI